MKTIIKFKLAIALLLVSLSSFAQTLYPASTFVPQFFNPYTNEPLRGGTIETFISGTSIPTTMYLGQDGDAAGSVINLNAAGYPEVSGVVLQAKALPRYCNLLILTA